MKKRVRKKIIISTIILIVLIIVGILIYNYNKNVQLSPTDTKCYWPPNDPIMAKDWAISDSDKLMFFIPSQSISPGVLCYNGRWYVTYTRDAADIQGWKESLEQPKGYIVVKEGDKIGSWVVVNGIWIQQTTKIDVSFCQSHSFYSSQGSVTNQACCANGQMVNSNTISQGDNRFLCYNGKLYVHDGDVSWLPGAERVSQSCTIVGNFYAYPNYPNAGWQGGWREGGGNGVQCAADKICQNGYCFAPANNPNGKIASVTDAIIEQHICDGYIDVVCKSDKETNSLEPWWNFPYNKMEIQWDRTHVNSDGTLQAVYRAFVDKTLSGKFSAGCYLDRIRADTDLSTVIPYSGNVNIGKTINVVACSTPGITCSSNSDCGTNGFVGDAFCKEDCVVGAGIVPCAAQNYKTYTCNNPGTSQSSCSNSNNLEAVDICGVNGCASRECVPNSDFVILSPEDNSIVDLNTKLKWRVNIDNNKLINYFISFKEVGSNSWNWPSFSIFKNDNSIASEGDNTYSMDLSSIPGFVNSRQYTLHMTVTALPSIMRSNDVSFTYSSSNNPATPEICTNGIDDNDNFLVDCDETTCDGKICSGLVSYSKGDGSFGNGNMICQNRDCVTLGTQKFIIMSSVESQIFVGDDSEKLIWSASVIPNFIYSIVVRKIDQNNQPISGWMFHSFGYNDQSVVNEDNQYTLPFNLKTLNFYNNLSHQGDPILLDTGRYEVKLEALDLAFVKFSNHVIINYQSSSTVAAPVGASAGMQLQGDDQTTPKAKNIIIRIVENVVNFFKNIFS